MKFLIFLFIPCLLFGQFKSTIKIKGNKIVNVNKSLIQFFENNLDKYSEWNGKTKFKIAYQKLFLKNCFVISIDKGYMTQFIKTGNDISVIDPNSKYIEIDLKNKKIKYIDKWENNDNNSQIKPDKIKEKIKKKIKFKP